MLHEVREKYASRGFEILGIAFVEGDERGKRWLEDFARRKQMTWPLVAAGVDMYREPFEDYDVQYVPFLLLLNKQGKVVDAGVLDQKKLEALIETWLAEPATPEIAELRGAR